MVQEFEEMIFGDEKSYFELESRLKSEESDGAFDMLTCYLSSENHEVQSTVRS